MKAKAQGISMCSIWYCRLPGFVNNCISRGEEMDKDRVKGAIDQVVGNTKRHIGNVIGDIRTQDEGAVQEIKGEVETGVGKLKDAVRDARKNAITEQEIHEEAQREKRRAELVEHHNLF
jgi:uncharacterized protein YjbJ (UPF0337 family)